VLLDSASVEGVGVAVSRTANNFDLSPPKCTSNVFDLGGSGIVRTSGGGVLISRR